MPEITPYAEVPNTPDVFIRQVQTELAAVCDHDDVTEWDVAVAARNEVLSLWACPVKAYIPVLAFRAARDQICPLVSSVPPALAASMTPAR